MISLRIRLNSPRDGSYPISLTLKRSGHADIEAEAAIQFALTPQEQEDLRWYLEDYLQLADTVEEVTIEQIETFMKRRGEELYRKVLTANQNTQALWFSIRNDFADLRVEVTTDIAEAASIPWELMRDPQTDSPISLRVKSFVRVQANPNVSFVSIPSADNGRIRLLYVVCRPSGASDVELRAVANRFLQDLGDKRARFDITALRPPTFEQLQKELTNAKETGRAYHIVHFDGHGIYEDLSKTTLSDWLGSLSHLLFGGKKSGKQGFLLFEHPDSDEKMRPVDGQTLGQILHDTGVPILVLNACQSAMHEGGIAHKKTDGVHDEIRAIGSLAQTVIDQGVPAVLGMRYSIYVVTAAQYIGQLYAALANGRSFGQAATEARKHLSLNPERWISLQPKPLQDWFVPVVYEAAPTELFPVGQPPVVTDQLELDPVLYNRTLLRHVPDHGFIGRDETLLALDRAFDRHRVVLLHAYAGQGKSATAVEFARWYALTGGLGKQPHVFLASFEGHIDLTDLLNQIGQHFTPMLESQGIHWSALNDTAQRQKRVLQLLRQFPILWIWDNVEPVAGFPEGTESLWTKAQQIDLRDFLKQITLDSASKVKILLTSRRDEQKWLGGIPHRIPMPRMNASDAASLAFELGKEKRINRSEIINWQPLLDYCAGNPLTLRVLVRQAVNMGLRDKQRIEEFVQAIRDGEQQIEDANEEQGRDKSLAASLDHGFKRAFKQDDLPIIALLHLFQGIVDVEVLKTMGKVDDHALSELRGKTRKHLISIMERARDIGLLTRIGPTTWFTIHPALPWFLRQLFARHYNGQAGRSSSAKALRAWVEAVGGLGDYCCEQYFEGSREVIRLLRIQEANLLHARRLAHRNQWWDRVISCMQGLRALYDHQGRTAEWARLVEEIGPDCFTPLEEPIHGREEVYSQVMEYRVDLARIYELDVAKAASLQEKMVAMARQKATDALELSADALDSEKRYWLRNLGVALSRLGQIMREKGNGACLDHFRESIEIARRIRDKTSEAVCEYNIGNAYISIPAIRNLDAAEYAYRRSLDLHDVNDVLGRSRCVTQVGMVNHERFLDARQQNEPQETLLKHFLAAEAHYICGLDLCPKDALADLGPKHTSLGNIYAEVGQLDSARKHFEKAAQYFDRVDDNYNAGLTRFNMANMYFEAARKMDEPPKRDYLRRALAYAEAAIRDFQKYQGRAAVDESKARELIEYIRECLSDLAG